MYVVVYCAFASSADGIFVQSVLRALRRACGLSKNTRPGRHRTA